MNRIFISYRRDDSVDVTDRICERLCEHFGARSVFTDVDGTPVGKDFRVHIAQEVGKCNMLLAVIGKDWIDATDEEGQRRRLDDPTDFVRVEIEIALRRGIPVVPLLVRGAGIPSPEQLPESLQELAFRQGVQIRPNPDFHTDMDRLIRSLEKLSVSREPQWWRFLQAAVWPSRP